MGLRINTNMASMAANRTLANSSEEVAKSMQRLASGNRINQAGDDAAGLSISESMRAQVRSMGQAERNAQDGISFVQVAEGGLNEVGNMLIRMRELAVQAASDTVGDKERGFIHQEVKQLASEVDRIANTTSFNGTHLLNGEAPHALTFQVGINKAKDGSDQLQFNPNDYNIKGDTLGISDISYKTTTDARDAMDTVDQAISKVFESRARLGAYQNKLHATVNNLAIGKENLSAARSRIADTDIAAETSELTRRQITQSAGISVLAQANSAPQAALKLL